MCWVLPPIRPQDFVHGSPLGNLWAVGDLEPNTSLLLIRSVCKQYLPCLGGARTTFHPDPYQLKARPVSFHCLDQDLAAIWATISVTRGVTLVHEVAFNSKSVVVVAKTVVATIVVMSNSSGLGISRPLTVVDIVIAKTMTVSGMAKTVSVSGLTKTTAIMVMSINQSQGSAANLNQHHVTWPLK